MSRSPRGVAGLASRRAALEALRSVEERGAWSNLAVPAAIASLDDERDRAFAARLAYDVLRWQGTLDWALARVVTRPIADVEPGLRRVLRLGAWQLLYAHVPARAAVDTAVALAREQVPSSRGKGATGFVNGVLRALDRQRGRLPWPDAVQDPVGHLSLTTAHPAWIVLDLLDREPLDRVRAVLEADDRPPGLTLRAVEDPQQLVEELGRLGLEARRGATVESIRVPGADPRRLAAVAEGRAVPQDEASMMVVHATSAGPGDLVLDLCAGPGGKATHLARVVGPTGRVTAVELHEHRAELVRQAAARQGVEVDVRVGDATTFAVPAGEPSFDVVLLDAPCTGLGTGRRRPEIRWRRTPEDATELAMLQRRLLATAAEAVRPGGTLTYSVCTWTAVETIGVADDFDAGGFVPVTRRQLMPDRDDTDGMFIATWRRPEAG